MWLSFDDFLRVLKFVPDWFVISKMIEKLDDALFVNDNIVKDSGNVTFSSNKMDILSVDLNNINLDEVKFDVDDAESINNVRLKAWRNKFQQQSL